MKAYGHFLDPDFYGDILMGGLLRQKNPIPGVYSRHDSPPKECPIQVQGKERTLDFDMREAIIGSYVEGDYSLKEERWIKPHEALYAPGRMRSTSHVGGEKLSEAGLPASSGKGMSQRRGGVAHVSRAVDYPYSNSTSGVSGTAWQVRI